MKEFFKQNKLFLVVVIGAVIISVGVYQNNGSINRKGSDNLPISKDVLKIDNSGPCLAKSEVLVTKVIDGDTIVVEGGYHVRLLSMDADEAGYPCYQDAKIRLEELVLNKKIRLEKDKSDVDQYKRCLRYVFLDKWNIDLELVKEGLAVARFYEPDVKYKKEITLAEKTAIENKVGCKWRTVK